jgi:NADPH-dependent 2,4-dienoyl-CoA reductase/sulfur reductase-like enzyme
LVKLANNHGVAVIVGTAESVSPGQVTLAGGPTLTCRRLVLATGISFEKLPGWDQTLMPHAWIAGPQTTLLRDKLRTLRKGDRFVMTIPLAPYRCPPGPYERACVVADMLKRLGGGKVTVLDANPGIVAEKHTFDTAFRTIYRDIIDYRPGTEISSIDSANMKVNEIQGKVVNIIAPHSAPALLQNAGLTNGGKWAPVNPLTYESTVAGRKGIHIIGDSCTDSDTAPVQPKSAHMANSQAKVCADAIVRYTLGIDLLAVPDPDPDRTANITTNSACYSPITYSEASWLTANYSYDIATKRMKLVHLGEAEKWDGENFEDMFTWASNLFTDSFT